MNTENIAYAAFAATPKIEGENEKGWIARVANTAIIIATNLDPEHSPVLKAINSVSNLNQKGGTTKTFTATIIGYEIEKNSGRMIAHLYTGTQQKPNGVESAKTDFTTNPAGKEMGRKIINLIGHKVKVFIELESFTDKQGYAKKMRVLKHLTDIGIDSGFQIETDLNGYPLKATKI